MAQWAEPGATLALPASEEAQRPQPPTGFSEPELREYAVPGTDVSRRLWVLKTAS